METATADENDPDDNRGKTERPDDAPTPKERTTQQPLTADEEVEKAVAEFGQQSSAARFLHSLYLGKGLAAALRLPDGVPFVRSSDYFSDDVKRASPAQLLCAEDELQKRIVGALQQIAVTSARCTGDRCVICRVPRRWNNHDCSKH